MSRLATQPARASGEFAIGGDLPVVRLGYGTMQIPGPGVWGAPRDHDEVIRVLRRALELGVTFIDTADSYGPEVSERLIREALHPYPDDLVSYCDKSRPDTARPRALGAQRQARGTSRPRPRRAFACSAWSASSCFTSTASIRRSRSPTSWALWWSCKPKAKSDASRRSQCWRSKPLEPLHPSPPSRTLQRER